MLMEAKDRGTDGGEATRVSRAQAKWWIWWPYRARLMLAAYQGTAIAGTSASARI